MSLATQDFILELMPGKHPPHVKATQYDAGPDGWKFAAHLRYNDEDFTVPSGYTATVEGSLESQGLAFRVNATIDGSVVSFSLDTGDLPHGGRWWAKILLKKGDSVLQPSGFVIDADPAGTQVGTVTGGKGFEEQIREAVADYLDESDFVIDPTLTISGAAADAKVTGDVKSALNIVNPKTDIKWTLAQGVGDDGSIINNPYTANSNKIPCDPGDKITRTGTNLDGNGKFLVYYVSEFNGDSFIKRTEFTSSVKEVILGASTNYIYITFGRYTSSDITISQNDINSYFSIQFLRKSEAKAELNEKLKEYVHNGFVYTDDVNNIVENSFRFVPEGTANLPTPTGGYFIQTILYGSDATAAMQIAYKFDNGLIYYRRNVSGTWRTWYCVSSHSIPSDPLYYAFGDSLTYGAVWTPKDESPYYQITQASLINQIPTRIANAIGAANSFSNKGVGGAYFVGTGTNKIITAIRNQDLSNAKIITIAGGRNDSENTLGDKTSTSGDGTICGAIREILDYVTTNYKKLQVVWIGVTPNTRDNSTVFTRVFAGGWSLNSFDENVSELCAEYGVPYVDWKMCTYIRHWADFSGAGDVYSHPNNENSYLQMGNYLAGKVSAFYKG